MKKTHEARVLRVLFDAGAALMLAAPAACGDSGASGPDEASDAGAERAVQGASSLHDGAPEAAGSADAMTDTDSARSDGTMPDARGDDAHGEGDGATADATTGDAATGDATMGDASSPADGGAVLDGPSGEGSTADSGSGCGPDNTACQLGAGGGLCRAGTCTPCRDVADDGNCGTAYGGGAGFLCLSGSCTPGDCRTNSDCAASSAPLCGASVPNMCGACSLDSQCGAANAATPLCNTATGQCGAAGCSSNPTNANPPPSCSQNPADVCCGGQCVPSGASGPTNRCCALDPNANAYCTNLLGQTATCTNSVCTTCGPVTQGQYFVDPLVGSDDTGTGIGTVSGCQFKTITHTLQVIGNDPSPGTTIDIQYFIGEGETFPLVIPPNVTLVADESFATINVPPGKAGVILSGAGAGINGFSPAVLTVSGYGDAGVGVAAYGAATYGVVVPAAGTSIANLVVEGFVGDGIRVEQSGALSIATGVMASYNATGLHITGGASASFDPADGGTGATYFSYNTGDGIVVDGSGVLAVHGTVTDPTAPRGGDFITEYNSGAGLLIQQTPGSAAENDVTGLLAYLNSGDGIRLCAGSNVRLRACGSLLNSGSGVRVVSLPGPNGSNDISAIDLGNSGAAGGPDYGHNTVQSTDSQLVNAQSGICLATDADAGTLQAAGNLFATGVLADCSMTRLTLEIDKGGCGNNCLSATCDLGIVDLTGNDINVSLCTHP